MTTRSRSIFLGSAASAVVAVCLWWSLGQWMASQASARTAAADLVECRRLGRQLQGWRTRQPLLAGSTEAQKAELSLRMEQAARSAQFSDQAIERIEHESPRRLGNSAFLQSSTHVLLRQVNLRQLIGFLHTLSTEDSGLLVTSLRLWAPREQEIGDRWNAEATLSYLVYSPQSANEPSSESR